MKQYDSYKDSGINWIGKIPSHWEVCRLKNHSKIVLGKMIMSTPPKGEEAKYTLEKYLKSRNIGWLNVIDSEDEVDEMWFNQYEKELYRLHTNDIVMNEGGDIGKIGLWNNTDYPCYIQNSVNKITADNVTSPFYLQYLLFAIAKTNYFWSIVNPISIAHLTKEKLSSTPIVLPPLSEQEVIASYLDKKCGEIDKAIATQEKRVELLKELRQNIITQAVTRGINPDAPLKDSGVKWIGDISAHWDMMKMSIVCKVITDYVASGSFADLRNNVEYLDSPDYAMLVRTADLSNKNKDISRVYVSKSSYNFLSNSNLFGGEIILPNVGSIGDVYMVPFDLYEKMTLAPNSIMVKTNYNDLYYYYYFSSLCGRKSLELLGMATTQGKFNKTELRQMRVPVPPLSEQQEIVSYIESQTARLDASIEKAEHQIELLQELKQSIITEVVTGKRKVV